MGKRLSKKQVKELYSEDKIVSYCPEDYTVSDCMNFDLGDYDGVELQHLINDVKSWCEGNNIPFENAMIMAEWENIEVSVPFQRKPTEREVYNKGIEVIQEESEKETEENQEYREYLRLQEKFGKIGTR